MRQLTTGRSATSSTRTRTPITSAATSGSARQGADLRPRRRAGRRRPGRARRDHRARRDAEPDERARRGAGADAGRRVADVNVLRQAQGVLLQRRGRADHPPPVGAHRRRQRRVLPALRRDRRGRRLLDRQLPDHRPAARRQHHGRPRRAEPAARSRHRRREDRRRHDDRSRPRPHLGRSRPGRVPRHGDDHSRSHAGHGQPGDDAGAGAGCTADDGVRRSVRLRTRVVGRAVRRRPSFAA